MDEAVFDQILGLHGGSSGKRELRGTVLSSDLFGQK